MHTARMSKMSRTAAGASCIVPGSGAYLACSSSRTRIGRGGGWDGVQYVIQGVELIVADGNLRPWEEEIKSIDKFTIHKRQVGA